MDRIMGMPVTKMTIKDCVGRSKTAHWLPIEKDGEPIVYVSDKVDSETYRAVRDLLIKAYAHQELDERAPEDQVEAVARLLGIEVENLGGNLPGFMFSKEGTEKTLVFGYANGPLGHNIWDDASGDATEIDEMPQDGPHDAKAQAAFVRAACERLGYADSLKKEVR